MAAEDLDLGKTRCKSHLLQLSLLLSEVRRSCCSCCYYQKAYWRLSLGLRWKKASSGSLFFPAAPSCLLRAAACVVLLPLHSPPPLAANLSRLLHFPPWAEGRHPMHAAIVASKRRSPVVPKLTRPALHRHKSTSTKREQSIHKNDHNIFHVETFLEENIHP